VGAGCRNRPPFAKCTPRVASISIPTTAAFNLAVLENCGATIGYPEAAMLNTPVSIEFAGAAAEFTDRTSFIDGVKIVAPVGCVAGTRGAGAVTIAASPGTVVAVPVIIVIPQSGGCRDRLAIRPLVAVAEEGEGGDAVVPVPIAFASHGDPMQIVYVVVNKEAGTAKIGIVEDAKAGFAEDADGSDSVIESGRHGGPALASLETKRNPHQNHDPYRSRHPPSVDAGGANSIGRRLATKWRKAKGWQSAQNAIAWFSFKYSDLNTLRL